MSQKESLAYLYWNQICSSKAHPSIACKPICLHSFTHKCTPQFLTKKCTDFFLSTTLCKK